MEIPHAVNKNMSLLAGRHVDDLKLTINILLTVVYFGD